MTIHSNKGWRAVLLPLFLVVSLVLTVTSVAFATETDETTSEEQATEPAPTETTDEAPEADDQTSESEPEVVESDDDTSNDSVEESEPAESDSNDDTDEPEVDKTEAKESQNESDSSEEQATEPAPIESKTDDQQVVETDEVEKSVLPTPPANLGCPSGTDEVAAFDFTYDGTGEFTGIVRVSGENVTLNGDQTEATFSSDVELDAVAITTRDTTFVDQLDGATQGEILPGSGVSNPPFEFVRFCAEPTEPVDSDGDGVPDADEADGCEGTPSGESVNADGCSDSQLDNDQDGVNNASDDCANTPSGVEVDSDGCEVDNNGDDGDFTVPIDTVKRGDPGDTITLTTVSVPEDLRGKTCSVKGVAENQSSVHLYNDLTIASGDGSVVLPNVEREAGVTTNAEGDLVLGDTVTVYLTFGPDGVFSAGMDVIFGDCEVPPTVVDIPAQPAVIDNCGVGNHRFAELADTDDYTANVDDEGNLVVTIREGVDKVFTGEVTTVTFELPEEQNVDSCQVASTDSICYTVIGLLDNSANHVEGEFELVLMYWDEEFVLDTVSIPAGQTADFGPFELFPGEMLEVRGSDGEVLATATPNLEDCVNNATVDESEVCDETTGLTTVVNEYTNPDSSNVGVSFFHRVVDTNVDEYTDWADGFFLAPGEVDVDNPNVFVLAPGEFITVEAGYYAVSDGEEVLVINKTYTAEDCTPDEDPDPKPPVDKPEPRDPEEPTRPSPDKPDTPTPVVTVDVPVPDGSDDLVATSTGNGLDGITLGSFSLALMLLGIAGNQLRRRKATAS